MASKRRRGESWEYTIKRAGVLDKPLTLTFRSEVEGDEYCRKLEGLLDRGIVPTEHRPKTRVVTLEDLIDRYMHEVAVPGKDTMMLTTVRKEVGSASILALDANWVDDWISSMKREKRHAPATIRAKVGALARCCDWGMRKKIVVLPDHPLRTLREGYASYTKADAAFVEPRSDEERDRRLEPGEEGRIRVVLAKGVLERTQRPYTVPHIESVRAIFDLALETAMRLREMYTLTIDQVNLNHRVVFLDKTKNGDSRQVPLSSVATRILSAQTTDKTGGVFPWLEMRRGSLELTSNYLSKLFADIFKQARCPDLHFHDLRHEAVSRLFERTTLSVEEIMKISGHRTHRMVMRYLKLRSSDLVAKLW